jgi:GTP-binding protein LepA
VNNNNIRNFCIIAHIDHGKSTLADRIIEFTNTLPKKDMKNQLLDNMDIERERGITIKSHPIKINYLSKENSYQMNLIDTPGHVDFTYEVSRSMAACEGAVLLVDAAQGVEAQTVSNAYLAMEANLTIIPVLNKIDIPNIDIEDSEKQLIDLLGCRKEDIIRCSAKDGIGTEEILESIIKDIPPPREGKEMARGLIFDSFYDQYRGVVTYLRMFDGSIRKGQHAEYFSNNFSHEIIEVGDLKLGRQARNELDAGDVGYAIINTKNVEQLKVGDTLTTKEFKADSSLPGYKDIKPMVFSGLYPVDSQDYQDLRSSLDKLKLNDSSLEFIPNTSHALGFGFRCGFLGPLHMEIVQERLEREFDMNLITTSPNVRYKIKMNDNSEFELENPSEMPDVSTINTIYEPYIRAEIITPSEFIGTIMKICINKRGEYKATNYLSQDKAQLIFHMPLGEIIYDFFERLKASSKGYATLDYELIDDKPGKLNKLDVKIAGEIIDALSIIIHKDKAYKSGSELCKKLKKIIPRHQFEVPIQAVIGTKIVSRETVRAFRKNVIAKCYGGDITRKRKLLEKQKAGKKRMKKIGMVDLPQEAFLAILNMDEE